MEKREEHATVRESRAKRKKVPQVQAAFAVCVRSRYERDERRDPICLRVRSRECRSHAVNAAHTTRTDCH